MLPGGLFVSRPDFLRRVAGKQRAHDSLNLFGAACVSYVRHLVPQCGRGGGTGAPAFLHPLLSVVGIFVLGKAVLGFIAG